MMATKTAIPDDRVLVQLYRRFSEEEWCAGWIGMIDTDDSIQSEFRAWLRGGVSEHLSPLGEGERRALPTLRRLYAEVFGSE